MGRWIRFSIAILVGIAAGLAYGWIVDPVAFVDTAPNTLKVDYKSDYVLMVAEAYQSENDLSLASRRLALLGDQPPLEYVRQALIFAERVGYIDADISRMRALFNALQTWSPFSGTQPP